jgi:hypothetical protein
MGKRKIDKPIPLEAVTAKKVGEQNPNHRGGQTASTSSQTRTRGLSCQTSFIFALYYLLLATALIIIPWALPNFFPVSAAFAVNIIGALLFVGAIAPIYYISRVVSAGRRNECSQSYCGGPFVPLP